MDGWNLMRNWHLVIPPSRPSALQLEWIRGRIAETDRSRSVAILGSTPEFRDLLYESGFTKIHVFERNKVFYDVMTSMRVGRNLENLIEGDWLETISAYRDRFAVILSDLTSGNIPYEARAKFYESIEVALQAGGKFFDKILTHGIPLKSTDALIDKYARLPLNLIHINHFSSEMLFCSELLMPEGLVDSSAFYSVLEDRVKNPRVLAFVEAAKLITPPGCRWWYGRAWNELQSNYCPHLNAVDVVNDESGSPYEGYLKFFEWEKPGARHG